MRVALCLDDRQGMMFNHRRQSRDRVLIADLLADLQGRLLIKPYSAPLFNADDTRITLCESPMELAGKGDLCFIEDEGIAPYLSKISEIVIYRWNRHYPADLYFDYDMSGYTLVRSDEFVGSSHERITKEVWRSL